MLERGYELRNISEFLMQDLFSTILSTKEIHSHLVNTTLQAPSGRGLLLQQPDFDESIFDERNGLFSLTKTPVGKPLYGLNYYEVLDPKKSIYVKNVMVDIDHKEMTTESKVEVEVGKGVVGNDKVIINENMMTKEEFIGMTRDAKKIEVREREKEELVQSVDQVEEGQEAGEDEKLTKELIDATEAKRLEIATRQAFSNFEFRDMIGEILRNSMYNLLQEALYDEFVILAEPLQFMTVKN